MRRACDGRATGARQERRPAACTCVPHEPCGYASRVRAPRDPCVARSVRCAVRASIFRSSIVRSCVQAAAVLVDLDLHHRPWQSGRTCSSRQHDALVLASILSGDLDRRPKLRSTHGRTTRKVEDVECAAVRAMEMHGGARLVTRRPRNGMHMQRARAKSSLAHRAVMKPVGRMPMFTLLACADVMCRSAGTSTQEVSGSFSRAVRSAAVAFEEWCERGESSGGDGLEETEPYVDAARRWERPQPASQSA